MSEALAFADAVAARCTSVLLGRDVLSTECCVGDLRFRVTAPVEAGQRWIGSAFVRFDGSSGREDHEHTIQVWDGVSPETSPPARPWGPDAHEPLGLIKGFCDDRVRCAFDIHTNSLIVQHRRKSASYIWYPHLTALPAWAQASPFRIAVSWLANSHAMQVVHAAAVAIDGRAVLLAGPGGSGKSTTALACALSGMRYLGDDYCVVEPGSCRVHMLYNTAKLLGQSLDMLPGLQSWIVNADRIEQEKGVLFLGASDVPLASSAEIAAILLPRVTGCTHATIRRGTSHDALHAILPSTVGGLMGGGACTPSLLMKLVHSAPVYHLALGTDIDSVVEVVHSVLERKRDQR